MFFVFDVGATRMRFGIAKGGRVEEVRVVPTPRGLLGALKIFSDYAESLGKPRFSAIAGSTPGHLDRNRRRLSKLRNLPGWSRADIGGALRKRFHCPVYWENDVRFAALGEARYGAGRGKAIVVYVTVSTGVNGARVVNNKLDQAAWGFSIGHQLITPDHDLESLVGGAALKLKYGRSAEKIKNPRVWKQVHAVLARGLFNTLLYWSPEVLVLGGGMVLAGAIKIPVVRRELIRIKHRMRINVPIPPLRRARLGQLAGLYGALAYLQQRK